jgi:hypothetical protein
MSWFSKKGPTPREVRAYQMGQQAGEEMATAFRIYQEQRFGPVYIKYLNIFRDALQSALKQEDKPPLLMCRAHMDVIEENVKELRTQMFEETKSSMAEWFERARAFGLFDEAVEGVRQSIDSFCNKLLNEAAEIIEQYMTVITDVDEAWRRKYPDKAAKYGLKSV